jgi:phage tail sheath protein FI
MAQYKTPDVYVKEKSLLAPSVAEVATAIPAFIGFTQKIVDGAGESIIKSPQRLTSLAEYEAIFGSAQLEAFTVQYDAETEECYVSSEEQGVPNTDDPTFFLYQAVSHYFANGGGTCYVVSIGGHHEASSIMSAKLYMDAIDLLQEVDEVTLLSAPESVLMDSVAHYSVQNYALQHCEKMKDRFALVDVQQAAGFNRGDLSVDAPMVRDQVANGLQYGAAYYPYVRTTIARAYDEAGVVVSYSVMQQKLHQDYSSSFVDKNGDALDQYGKNGASGEFHVVYIKLKDGTLVDKMGYAITTDVDGNVKRNVGEDPYGIFTDGDGLESHYLNYQGFVMADGDSNELSADNIKSTIASESISCNASLEYLSDPKWRLASTALHAKINAMLSSNYLVLPPSAAIAGVMAKVDGSRGVWKAPANVALAKVKEPCVAIDNGEQADMNVDVIAGKSINAIRSFIGKGSLVWGARTLKGNDNEWRYVSVRRLFNMIEESVQKASHFAVFEPNTPFTWLKLKTMIENYLENLWRQGALFGDSPSSAFFVNVGLGQTMTEDDINNGLMHIEIGLAAVRPAEFIVLTFSHKSLEG